MTRNQFLAAAACLIFMTSSFAQASDETWVCDAAGQLNLGAGIVESLSVEGRGQSQDAAELDAVQNCTNRGLSFCYVEYCRS